MLLPAWSVKCGGDARVKFAQGGVLAHSRNDFLRLTSTNDGCKLEFWTPPRPPLSTKIHFDSRKPKNRPKLPMIYTMLNFLVSAIGLFG